MKKALKTIFRVGGWMMLTAVLLAVIALRLFFFNKPLVKSIAQRYIAGKTGLTVRIGKLDYSLSPLSIAISSLEISQDTPVQSLDIRAGKVEAKGDFWRLLRREKPFFETVHFDGTEIRYRLKKLPEARVDYRKVIGRAAAALESVKEIKLSGAGAAVDLPGQAFVLEKADLDLAEAGLPKSRKLSLSSGKMRLELKNGKISLECRLDSAGSLTLAENPRLSGRFSLGSLAFAGGRGTQSFDSVLLETDVEWETSSDIVSVSLWKADIPGLVKAAGSADIGFAGEFSLSARTDGRVEDVGAVLRAFEAVLPPNMKVFQARGTMKFGGTFHSLPNPQGRKENLEARLETERISLRSSASGAPSKADVSGRLTASGPLSDLRVAGAIHSTVVPPATKNLKLRKAELDVKLEAGRDFVRVPDFAAVLKGLTFSARGKEISFDEVKSRGRAGFDISRRTLALDGMEVRIPGLPPLDGSAKVALAAGGESRAALTGAGFRISEVRSLFSSFLPPLRARWEFDAVCGLRIEVRAPGANRGDPEFSAVLRFDEGKFHDASFSLAGEGLCPEVRMQGRYSIPRKSLSFSGNLKLEQGESLWKAFYIPWRKFPMTADFSGVYHFASGTFDPLSVLCSSPALGEVSVRGACSLPAPFSLSLGTGARLELDSLQSLFAQAGGPRADRVYLKGSMSGEARVSAGAGGLSVKGRLRLEKTSLESQNGGFFLREIDAEIPVFLMTGGELGTRQEDPVDRGFFRAGALQAGPFMMPRPVSLELRSEGNAFHIEPFSLDFFGGQISFGEASLVLDTKMRTFAGSTSVRLSGLDISRIPLNPSQFHLSGEARAEFARVDISPEKISARGEGEIDIFGGKVIVKDISVLDPFRRGRAVVLNADFVDLNLKKVTDSVPFGEVTGIIRGEIRDLSISYGQPERFNLKLESVKKEGVPRTFSLKAVDNITVISSGEPASLGTSQFWMRFIRGFRYDKIGIVSTLKNDTFTLNGTIKENGIEYLVKKPGPFGINVINRMPEKKISFKEMTQRLKRVGQSEKQTTNK